MAIDWKTILSEFDGKPTLLQAIGKLRKAVEEETMTIQEAQDEIAKLEAQLKTDEAKIETNATAVQNAHLEAVAAQQTADTAKANAATAQSAAEAADTKAQQALDLATTNETDIGTLDGQVAEIETNLNNKQDKITDETTLFLDSVNASRVSASLLVGNALRKDDGPNQYILFLPNKEGTLATTDDIPTQFKTLFGNQSIIGSGNIDLYRHHINYIEASGSPIINIYADIYSSKNILVDSLTDLKTLLGDTFQIQIYGDIVGPSGIRYIPLYMDETSVNYVDTDNSFGIALLNGTFSDTVTSI